MTDSRLRPLPKATSRQIIKRGLRGQCPNCGRAKLSKSLLKIEHHCLECGMPIKRGDGYYLGPLCLNYGVSSFVFVIPVLILGFLNWIELKVALALALCFAVFLPIALYRWSWSCWLTLYYVCLPEELHANRPDDCDDLSFEEERRSGTNWRRRHTG